MVQGPALTLKGYMSLNLLRYFIAADEELPASYVKRCKRFLKKFTSKKIQASRDTQAPQLKDKN
jgi:hypothetical protein